ncbi:MAG: hypothetical protein ACI9N1_002261 [Flavobacteriales bacterium]|jgi:hypothetical protein
MKDKDQDQGKTKFGIWLKRIGLAGFIFFLAKGIGWILLWWFGFSFFKGCAM